MLGTKGPEGMVPSRLVNKSCIPHGALVKGHGSNPPAPAKQVL